MRKTVIALLTAVSLVMVLGVATAANKKPDATIELKGKSVGAGLGVTWGTGILKFKGKSYPITIQGVDLGDVGVANVTATGKVYDLKKLADFNGNYTGVSAGATVAGGGGGMVLKNQNGVVLNLTGTTQGLKFKLGVDGVKITLKQ